MLADAIHCGTGRQSILPDSLAIIIDETHKLPEAAHQMFGVTLRAEDVQGLIHDLRREKYLPAAPNRALTVVRKQVNPPALRLCPQVPGQAGLADEIALPDMRITDDLREVEAFIRSVKGPDYFREGGK